MSSVAHVAISAVGILGVPKSPYKILGVLKFKGASFHSAQWSGLIDMQNKRVAVIGNEHNHTIPRSH
jgi:cation diffusion facilitator CzcD-associated flavoprotein CzcO